MTRCTCSSDAIITTASLASHQNVRTDPTATSAARQPLSSSRSECLLETMYLTVQAGPVVRWTAHLGYRRPAMRNVRVDQRDAHSEWRWVSGTLPLTFGLTCRCRFDRPGSNSNRVGTGCRSVPPGHHPACACMLSGYRKSREVSCVRVAVQHVGLAS
jgi:hypothetical protein